MQCLRPLIAGPQALPHLENERKRERERQRQRERDKERQRDRERETKRGREAERQRDREREDRVTYLKGVKGRGRENRDKYIVTDRVGGNTQL